MNMFIVQMDMFLKHHSTVKNKKKSFRNTTVGGENHIEGTYEPTKTGQYFSELPMLSENSRILWKITTFHRRSGCSHCNKVWLDR